MKKISKDKYVLLMSKNNSPVERINSGETIIFECYDCYGGQIFSNGQSYESINWKLNNPATGPLFIEEAKVGDLLKIEIKSIKINGNGAMTIRPGAGALGYKWDEYRAKVIEIKNNKVLFNDKLAMPLKPMIGVIGTAPQNEDIKCTVPDYHGGNLDCKRIKEGSIVYLPVNIDGGLLSMGDIHGIMGDGEISISGLEVNGEVTVKIDVIKNYSIPTPAVITDKCFLVMSSKKTLDEASIKATSMMHDFLINELGIEKYDAAALLSLVGNLRINQIVDPLMTVRMELPLWVLEKYNYIFK